MSGQIFISYRREDSAGFAGRLYDRLRDRFGADHIFMDVGGIKLGLDFVEEIDKAVSSSQVLIALIGRNWLDVVDAEGNRRLGNPEDFVRLEILSALERGILVIPSLVGGATMPRLADLPEPLKPLARRQGLEISHIGFDEDVTRLIQTLEEVLAEARVDDSSAKPVPKELSKKDRKVSEKPSGGSRWQKLPVWSRVSVPLVGIGLLVGLGVLLISLVGGGTRQSTQKFESAIKDEMGVPMVLIPAGKFQMGDSEGEPSEQPAHSVLLDAYYIDQFEVTNQQYARCAEAGFCEYPVENFSFTREDYFGNPDYDEYPVVNILWEQAQTYCQWRGGRLPTEAEWEKAARGGLDGKEYPWGDEHPICDTGEKAGANFNDGLECHNKDTDPVGTYPANGYGLYDMAGNVWEMVADYYDPNIYESYAQGVENPTGPKEGRARIVRGGGFSETDSGLRVAMRTLIDPLEVLTNYGFRCVWEAQP